MKQSCFQWGEDSQETEAAQIELDPEAIDAVIVLMACALIAVVRTAEESADER